MNASKKIIALFDGNWHGHHPTYLKLISKILLENGYSVWVLCQHPKEIQQWLKKNVSDCYLSNFDSYTLSAMPKKNILSLCVWSLRNWMYASGCIKQLVRTTRCKPDVVLFLKMDDYYKGFLSGKLIDFVFPYPWTGLFIFLKFHIKIKVPFFKNTIYPLLSIFSAEKCKGVATLQEDRAQELQKIINKPVIVFPDITDDSPPSQPELINKILQKAKGRKIVGLIGGQDKRKGSFTLLKIAKKCRNKSLFFLFVGKVNSDKSDNELKQLKKLIGNENNWENCFFHFHRIPKESDFNGLINICDVIFAVYANFKCSSNMMTKAALFKKPIVVDSCGLMAKRVTKYKTGVVCDSENLDSCISAIFHVANDSYACDEFGSLRYYQKHSQKRFVTQLQRLINQASS